MFFDNFCELCDKKGVKPKRAATEIGLSNSITTKWKKGSVPNSETLIAIANYFGVSVADLIGEDKKTPDLKSEIGNDLDNELVEMLFRLNDVEIAQVRAYIQGLLASHKD